MSEIEQEVVENKLTTEEEKRVLNKAQKVGATQAAREFSTRNPKKVGGCTVRKTLKKYKFFFYLEKKTQKNNESKGLRSFTENSG